MPTAVTETNVSLSFNNLYYDVIAWIIHGTSIWTADIGSL